MGVDVTASVVKPSVVAEGNGYYLARDPWEHLVGANREWTKQVVKASDLRARLTEAQAMVDTWPDVWKNGDPVPSAYERERFKDELMEFVERCEEAETEYGALTIEVCR